MSRRFSPSTWLAAPALVALSMLAMPTRSEANGVGTINCHRSFSGGGCVFTYRRGRFNPHLIHVPRVRSDDEDVIKARDRRWEERCTPVIRQDRYGMPRYSYGAPGCEYGRLD